MFKDIFILEKRRIEMLVKGNKIILLDSKITCMHMYDTFYILPGSSIDRLVGWLVGVIVFNATFNNISIIS
jgi:hypothetical protein